MGFLDRFFDSSKRELKSQDKAVRQILDLEDTYAQMSDEELKNQTNILKERLNNGETLDDILVPAFATVREAASRTLGMKHFPVQLRGGMTLHKGNIAEMSTGEGKTLVATLPAYLNALEGRGVYIVTVNDYLAQRDAEWMGKIYEFLGLSVGLIIHGLDFDEKKAAYNADITYGTNNEFGFDYLRDNMAISREMQVQRELNYAIIDEVDSILIDEARTPLIISGSGDESTKLYKVADGFIKTLNSSDYEKDEEHKSVMLTETGVAKAERFFKIDNLTDVENMQIYHNIQQALHANIMMNRDVDYMIKDGEVLIVDEFTGRPMPGRRYSNGLHQAIEAKERVKVNKESKTLATITFQNYFRMFNKLAGMTGTAKTEEEEFLTIYNLNVVTIPTNKPMIRKDMNDLVYRSEAGKFKAITQDVMRRHATGQPVLIGTVSIEKSEELSDFLRKHGIKHNVLNAKYLAKEADIIAQAGQMGAVTISTNMAGRGTDIVLGDGVAELGGLHIIGTERHESRRIDNQLRGRAGRQGDPGSSQFYVSLEDDLMRIFGSDKIAGLMESIDPTDEAPIQLKMVTKSIENAQKKVESRNFEQRKTVLNFDDVMNRQRELIYSQRQQVLNGENMDNQIWQMATDLVNDYVEMYTNGGNTYRDWDIDELEKVFRNNFFKDTPFSLSREPHSKEQLKEEILAVFHDNFNKKEELIGKDALLNLERQILLRSVDANWMNHIDDMDALKEGIGLRAYGQSDPVKEYTREGFDLFDEMTAQIQENTIKYLFGAQIRVRENAGTLHLGATTTNQQAIESNVNGKGEEKPRTIRKKKIGRNEPCPCGSGKKYKNCCGSVAARRSAS